MVFKSTAPRYKVSKKAVDQALALGITTCKKAAREALRAMARRGDFIRHEKGNLIAGGYVLDFGINSINGVYTSDGRDQRPCPACRGSCRGRYFGKGSPCDICDNKGFVIL